MIDGDGGGKTHFFRRVGGLSAAARAAGDVCGTLVRFGFGSGRLACGWPYVNTFGVDCVREENRASLVAVEITDMSPPVRSYHRVMPAPYLSWAAPLYVHRFIGRFFV